MEQPGERRLERPTADERTRCRELAESLARDAVPSAGTLLERTRPVAVSGETRVRTRPRAPGSIGIWRPVERAGECNYEVDPSVSLDERRLWAQVARLPGTVRRDLRIVLLGESTARGFLLDPAVTPARVLEQQLNAIGRCGEVEVIDLARTCLTNYLDAALEALQLRPDVVVFLAGNNVLPTQFATGNHGSPWVGAAAQQRAAFARALGPAGLVRAVEDVGVASVLRPAFAGLAELVRRAGMPWIFVVPDSNLADWADDFWLSHAVPTWLSGADLEHWQALGSHVEAALRAGRAADAVGHATRLCSLDGGHSSWSRRALGLCQLAAGDAKQAREHLRAAADLYAVHASGPPRPHLHSAVRALFSEVLDVPGSVRIELSSALGELGDCGDRRAFFDYCHLTGEGIRSVMAAVATAVETVARGGIARTGSASDYASVQLELAPEAEATAACLAAVHNAHWGQTEEIVAHWLARAAAAHGRSLAIVLGFLAAGNGPCAGWMSADERDLFDPSTQLGRHWYLHRAPVLDETLVRAVRRVWGADASLPNRWLERWALETSGRVALAALASTSLFAAAQLDGAVLSCRRRTLHLPFVRSGSGPCTLRLLLRRERGAARDAAALLRVDGLPWAHGDGG